MGKILIIRLSSLGDVILTTPLIRKLRQIFPNSEIDYCTKSEYADIFRNNPDISKIIEAENDLNFGKLRQLKKRLKQESYDLIIDAHNKLNTFYLRLFLKGRKKKFRKYSIRKILLVKFKINLMKRLPPVRERYLNILKGDKAKSTNENYYRHPEIVTDTESKLRAEGLIKEINPDGKTIICIIPSSKHYTKTYPPELYADFINKLDTGKFTVVLAGKGNDKLKAEKIKTLTGKFVIDMFDKLNLPELTELIKRSSLIISGDTGPMHIAEAVNTPLLMLAGSSVKEFGFYPQSKKSVVIENKAIKCRPCSHIGRDSCPKGHFKCMKEIQPDSILKAAYELLEKSQKII